MEGAVAAGHHEPLDPVRHRPASFRHQVVAAVALDHLGLPRQQVPDPRQSAARGAATGGRVDQQADLHPSISRRTSSSGR